MVNHDDDGIASSAKRLQKVDKQHHTSSEREQRERARVHRSIYLEQSIYDRLDEAYKKTRHDLYPTELRKSTFMETCIAYALDHLPEIKTLLHKDT